MRFFLILACLLLPAAPARAQDITAAAIATAGAAVKVTVNPAAPATPVGPATPAAPVVAAVPAATFFPVLPLDAPPDAPSQLVPVASSHPLDGGHVGIIRAIVTVHDASRDAGHALALITALAGTANSDTLILAPQFLIEPDVNRFADHLPGSGKQFARWPYDAQGMTWKTGGDSVSLAQQHGVSSFTVMDLLLLYLNDRQNFPDLRQIVVTGSGDGADFVQLYAAAGQAPELIDPRRINLRFVVVNAASYLYVTAGRPQAGHGFTPPPDAATACPLYNAWPYGLEGLPPYARRIGANAIKLGYVSRPVAYLSGTAAGANDPAPDTSCAALAEGPDRAARAANYAQYLPSIFGDAALKLQSFATVPQAGSDPVAVYGSRCGMTQLFGDGQCLAGF